MAFTREQLLEAIIAGQIAGGSPDLIADSIESKIRETRTAGKLPAPVTRSITPVHESLVSPVDTPAPEAPATPAPVPAPPPQVRLATETDIPKAAAASQFTGRAPVRLRSLAGGTGAGPMKMPEAIKYCEAAFPLSIDILPDGGERLMRLHRNIMATGALVKGVGSNDDYVKIIYKHNDYEDLIVQQLVSTSELGKTMMPEAVLSKILADAPKIYRVRARELPGVKPPVNPMTVDAGNGLRGSAANDTPEFDEQVRNAVGSGNQDSLRRTILQK